MDNIRLFLFMGLGLVLLLLYQAWMQDYGPRTQQAAEVAGAGATVADDESVPSAMPGSAGDGVPGSVPTQDRPRSARGDTVRVQTDRLIVEISTRGGDVRRVDLPTYPVSLDQPDTPFRLLDDGTGLFHIAQSGLLAADARVPNHTAEFTAERTSYTLAEGADTLVVPLRWEGENGLVVEKRFVFRRDSYLIDVVFHVTNGSGEPVEVSQYRQLQRTPPGDDGQAFIYTYTGGVIYDPEEKYQKIDFGDMEDKPLSRDIDHGWAAMIQHYFLAAWIPAPEETNRYETRALDGSRYLLRLISPAETVAPGSESRLATQLFVGPKEQERLEQVAEGLKLTVDY
ncbi:MAG: membrane protein insertase YidC, partial [Gammaproteobacteria bacterium]|nr:membrane protein insertase YidC [Gammaproteobacteria bacterium]